MTYPVQFTTDPEPRPTYDVDRGEYQRLVRLGIVVDAPADPNPPDLFAEEVAQVLEDTNGPAYAAGRAMFTPRATATPPTNPVDGELWFAFAP